MAEEEVEAPCSARPVIPSAIPTEATDHPEGRATVGAEAAADEVEEVMVEVKSGESDGMADVKTKRLIASGPPQMVLGAPEQGMLQLVESLLRLAPLLRTFEHQHSPEYSTPAS